MPSHGLVIFGRIIKYYPMILHWPCGFFEEWKWDWPKSFLDVVKTTGAK